MHITSIKDAEKISDNDSYIVTFSHETGYLDKVFKVSGVVGVAQEQLNRERRFQLLKVTKDAERDIAYRMFGDDWREHVSKEPYFSTQASEPIKACFLEGVALRPDLFGALD